MDYFVNLQARNPIKGNLMWKHPLSHRKALTYTYSDFYKKQFQLIPQVIINVLLASHAFSMRDKAQRFNYSGMGNPTNIYFQRL